MNKVDLEIHYGGRFEKSPHLKYVGGRVKICRNYDTNLISYFELVDLIMEAAENQKIAELYIKNYDKATNESFIKLHNDVDVLKMLKFGSPENNKFEIYSVEVVDGLQYDEDFVMD